MSHSYNHNEPLKSPENKFFSGVIAFYFSPFFFEHPVFINLHLYMHNMYNVHIFKFCLSVEIKIEIFSSSRN